MSDDHSFDQPPSLANALFALRGQVHLQMRGELNTRIQNNPHPTPEEFQLGTFIEDLEPQVRDAVRMLNAKGYSTDSSGFYGSGEYQAIDGMFSLDPETKSLIEQAECIIESQPNGYTFIKFWPKNPNINEIREKWTEIAKKLPDKGQPAAPSMSIASVNFRKKYESSDPAIYRLQQFIKVGEDARRIRLEEENKRRSENPKPTQMELELGTYIEGVEPQAREALTILFQKGYSVYNIGFSGNFFENQAVEGMFNLSEKTISLLRASGVHVTQYPNGYGYISFSPEEASIKAIIEGWKNVVSMIPDNPTPSVKVYGVKADNFRTEFETKS